MKTERPEGYVDLDGCHNCDHVFIKGEHGEGITNYYCFLNAIHPRPPCHSVAMGESCSCVEFWEGMYKAADRYYDPKEVAAWGRCPKWWPERSGLEPKKTVTACSIRYDDI